MLSKIEAPEDIAAELHKHYPTLTEFERLSLGIQIQRNQILENGLAVSKTDKNPSGLEAISRALGFTDNNRDMTVSNILEGLLDKMK